MCDCLNCQLINVQRDVLPVGKPNSPWRRLKLRIQTTNTLQVRGFCRIVLLVPAACVQQAVVWLCGVVPCADLFQGMSHC
jgi:hypothetical protein